MKVFIILAALFGLSYGTDLFIGSWKEDASKRENLNDYLYYRGLNWFKRVYVTNANFELTMNVAKEGDVYTISGKKGPKEEDYSFNLILDNNSRTDADLGQLGGPRKAVARMEENSMVTDLHKLDDDSVDVIAIRTIDPLTPNEMIYTLKDVASGSELVQHLVRQN